VYRILDKLNTLGLTTEKIDYSGNKFVANSPKELELLVIKKENELQTLKDSMPIILEQLSSIVDINKNDSKILYYKGIEGLKQITWNSLKAEKELLTMEIRDMDAFLDYGFCEKVRKEIVKRKLCIRTLGNQDVIKSWTKVEELVRNFWEIRYVAPEDLEIKFEVLLYNDVYCMYSYENDNIFCVEIYNEKLVKMQKQIFEFIWKHSREMEVLDGRGSARVK
jgi:hypothetical protein